MVLNWGHPRQGEGHITEYEIRHSLGTSLLGIKRVNGELTSYRVTGLQPDMQYRFEIRAFIGQLEGPSDAVTARTLVVSKWILRLKVSGSYIISLSLSQVRYRVCL